MISLSVKVPGKIVAFPVSLGAYPNGDPYVKFQPELLDRLASVVLVQPDTMGEFMAALFLIDSLQDRGYLDEVDLLVPFLTGSRQDRRFDTGGDLLFAAKSVAEAINMRHPRTVTTFDCHSDIPVGMINHCRNITAATLYAAEKDAFGTYDGIIIPDAGAEKRATSFAKTMGVERLVHAWKSRDVKSGALTGFGMEPAPPGHYLVVDDICDGGGTFLGLADVIDQQGSTADLYVTHGIFSQGTQKLKERFQRVITTDSIVRVRSDIVDITQINAVNQVFDELNQRNM